ncbi:MAG: aminoacyl-histidine dipeptidase [Lachnospiraceae bacterium]|nr:aminoacyl-histidine dipeptidase [Lachnospiraceae bacterium]
MSVLSELKPQRVFYYFEEISRIPRGSYHEKAISDYLVNFAREHNLEVYQDSLYNVVMLVPASEGRESEEPLILQGHMDMVCEKNPGADIDMEKEGLNLQVEGDYVSAKDTTLGGDDGIALAYMLAIADDREISHPDLEYIITVSEEVGMEGAKGIDLSMLKGHCMLNLDSEEEGIFLSSCAGGLTTVSTIPVKRRDSEVLNWYEVTVTGLLGGHSGCEIHKGRGNADLILGRVLYEIRDKVPFALCSLEGGKKNNAIPLEATAQIGVEEQSASLVETICERLKAVLQSEYAKSDANVDIRLTQQSVESRRVLDEDSLDRMITLLMTLPNGVQDMSMSVPGLVETSLNLGILKLNEDHLFLQNAIRSSVTTKKHYIACRVESLVKKLGGEVKRQGEYPAWEYREESVIRPKAVDLYEKMYGKAPVVEGIHAGLECGLLAGKIKELDCISMGPDILDIHTTSERLSIASVGRVYEFLIELLKLHW